MPENLDSSAEVKQEGVIVGRLSEPMSEPPSEPLPSVSSDTMGADSLKEVFSSARNHPLWQKKEKISKIQSWIPPALLVTALVIPPVLAAFEISAYLEQSSASSQKMVASGFAPTASSALLSGGVLPEGGIKLSTDVKISEDQQRSHTLPKSPEKDNTLNVMLAGGAISMFVIRRFNAKIAEMDAWDDKRLALMDQGFSRQDALTEIQRLKDLEARDRFDPVPDDHPLCVKVKEYGRQVGIEVAEVRLDPVPVYRNACAWQTNDNKAVIGFRGNPLLLPGGGETILKGVTAHELAHVKRNSIFNRKMLGATTGLYGVIAALGSLAVLSRGSSAAMSVVVGGAFAVLGALPFLSRWESRTDEALTDLEGAAIIGDPEALIANKEYFKNYSYEGVDDWSPSEKEEMGLGHALLRIFCGSTHPSAEERIKNLSTVFDIHKNESALINTSEMVSVPAGVAVGKAAINSQSGPIP